MAQMVKNPLAMWETWVQALGWEDPLQKQTVIHSRTIAWKVPWTEEPGGLPTMGLHKSWMRLSSISSREENEKKRDVGGLLFIP